MGGAKDKNWLTDTCVCGVLAAMVFVLYRKILDLWWMYDDAYLIRMLRSTTLSATLHDRAFYAQLGRPIFNPLLMVSWKLDLQRFGLNTRALYFHQLIALAVLSVLLYALFRLWSSRVASAAAAVVFLIAGPTLVVEPELMLRHYIEGAVFATAAVIAFVLALRRDSWCLAITSALLYFCGSAAKEVYAPLILILFAIPEKSAVQRFRFLLTHAIAAVVFVVWRILVIGSSVAPFGILPPPGKRVIAVITIPFRAIRQFADSGSAAGWCLVAMVIICAGVVLVRIPGARLLALLGIVAVVAPLVPVAGEMQARWAFAPWLLAIVPIAFLPLAVPRGGSALAAAVMLFAFFTYRVEWPRAYRLFRRMSDEALVFSKLGSRDALRDSATPPAAIGEIGRMSGSHARALNDDLPLCTSAQEFAHIVEYDLARREVVESPRASILSSCRSVRQMPLFLQLQYRPNGSFYWKLGPYRDGVYALIIGEGTAYEVPREAGFYGEGLQRFDFRVRYISPDGWKTYSSLLTADQRKGTLVYSQ